MESFPFFTVLIHGIEKSIEDGLVIGKQGFSGDYGMILIIQLFRADPAGD
jgi:hypothetical protein